MSLAKIPVPVVWSVGIWLILDLSCIGHCTHTAAHHKDAIYHYTGQDKQDKFPMPVFIPAYGNTLPMSSPSLNLTSNITLEGEMCPGGVEFTCSARNLSFLSWYLDDVFLVQYNVEESHDYPVDLCDQVPGDHSLLKDICSYRGSVVIQDVSSENDGKHYSFLSTLTLRAYFINNGGDIKYTQVLCGSDTYNQTLTTNFTVSCNNTAGPNPSINISSSDESKSQIELKCEGTDLPSFSWFDNHNRSLSDPYIHDFTSDHFPLTLQSSMPGFKIIIHGASKRNDYTSYFNILSFLQFNMTEVHSISCGSHGHISRSIIVSEGCKSANVSKGLQDFCNIDPTLSCSKVWKNIAKKCYAIAGVILAVTLICLCATCICCCCCYWKQKAKAKTNSEFIERTEARVRQDRSEREKSEDLIKGFVERRSDILHWRCFMMSDLGCRLQKFFFQGTLRATGSKVIITIAPEPKNCTLDPTDDLAVITDHVLPQIYAGDPFINSFSLEILLPQHENIHHVHGLYPAGRDQSQVIVVEQLQEKGSLRDKLYGDDFKKDWSEKYKGQKKVLSTKDIALYGRQVLEALKFLYKQDCFCPVGHVHTGNIFITEHGCVLGGFTNTLLGYRSRIHRLLGNDQDLLRNIDVIMFGWVILEMASQLDMISRAEKVSQAQGEAVASPVSIIPSQEDIEQVQDVKVKKVLKSIFKNGKVKATIKTISSLQFFKDHALTTTQLL